MVTTAQTADNVAARPTGEARMAFHGTTYRHIRWTIAALVAVASCTAARADVAGLDATTEVFCARAQQLIAGTERVAQNHLHRDYEAFVESRLSADPLATEQYVLYEDDRRTLPLRISCKLHTADRLASDRSDAPAQATEASCVDLHRAIVAQVHASLSAADLERVQVPPQRILLMPDQLTRLESSWIAPFDFAWFDAGDALNLQAKSLRIDWEDPLWSWAPERIRGLHYCHVIAPEYLRRLMMGERSAPQLPPVEPQ